MLLIYERYKQTAIWLFSFSSPLTRIQLWQIPGASNTIRAESAGIMINCEGHIHNGFYSHPGCLLGWICSSSTGRRSINMVHFNINQSERWFLHFWWNLAFVLCSVLNHWYHWLYTIKTTELFNIHMLYSWFFTAFSFLQAQICTYIQSLAPETPTVGLSMAAELCVLSKICSWKHHLCYQRLHSGPVI